MARVTNFDMTERKIERLVPKSKRDYNENFRPVVWFSTKFGNTGYTMVGVTNFDTVEGEEGKIKKLLAKSKSDYSENFRPVAWFSTKFGDTGYTMVALTNFDIVDLDMV